MRRRRSGLLIALVLVVASCGGGSSPDPQAFCERLARLTDNDPFAPFGERATDAEVATAFRALVARSHELLDVAPAEAKAAARDYVDAAEGLEELLEEAGFDGTRADARAYREQQVAYADAAARLERYLESECS